MRYVKVSVSAFVSLDDNAYHITNVPSFSDFDTSYTQSNQLAKVAYFAEEEPSLSGAGSNISPAIQTGLTFEELNRSCI